MSTSLLISFKLVSVQQCLTPFRTLYGELFYKEECLFEIELGLKQFPEVTTTKSKNSLLLPHLFLTLLEQLATTHQRNMTPK